MPFHAPETNLGLDAESDKTSMNPTCESRMSLIRSGFNPIQYSQNKCETTRGLKFETQPGAGSVSPRVNSTRIGRR